ncbi:MAG: queuosine precursor transporter [Phycisphaerales bacterium]|nr:queuosine precursor transporter [Planctomycetota bacterium]
MAETQKAAPSGRHYRYYDLLMAGFVTVLLCSNLIGPGKSCAIDIGAAVIPDWTPERGLAFGSLLVFGAGNIFFPISYIFGDVLTEVYGYARARKVIWAGFSAMIFATIMSFVVIRLPLNKAESYNAIIQPAIETVFGNTWRIVVASMAAFWVGDFVNSYVLAKMKVWTGGRMLWTRTIGSTICGQGVDSMLFYPIAFYGLWETDTLIKISIFNWVFKVGVEVVFTPLTYLVVGWLKRAESEDFYDRDTNFTPFSLQD